MNTETTSRVTVRNGTPGRLRVIFEPWCEEYELEPGAAYIFEGTSPRPGHLTVEYGSGDVTAYAWDGCVASIYDAGGQLLDSIDIRVPDFIELDRARRKDRDAAV
jgi:hypothetical protein